MEDQYVGEEKGRDGLIYDIYWREKGNGNGYHVCKLRSGQSLAKYLCLGKEFNLEKHTKS